MITCSLFVRESKSEKRAGNRRRIPTGHTEKEGPASKHSSWVAPVKDSNELAHPSPPSPHSRPCPPFSTLPSMRLPKYHDLDDAWSTDKIDEKCTGESTDLLGKVVEY